MSDDQVDATLRSSDTSTLLHWIEGEPVASLDGSSRAGENPATGGPGRSVALGSVADVERAVVAAEAAAPGWRKVASLERSRIIRGIADGIREDFDRIVQLEIADTGKPLATAEAEVRGAIEYFEFYAGLVHLPRGEVIDVAEDQHVYTLSEPYGVIGIITPWNLPLNQASRAIAPAITAGNVVVVKPAEATSATTVELARIATAAGLPPGVINVVLGQGSVVGTAIVQHPRVRKVAFTGSLQVGQEIGRIAADRILPLTLELGGKSANVVFADADLDAAATSIVRAFTVNAGQVCSAGTRLLVHRSVHDELLERVVEIAGRIRPGEDMGPMITRGQFEQVKSYFAIAQAEGARCVLGGAPAAASTDDGFYVQPTVYADVNSSMRIVTEEIFGPVLVVQAFDDESDAARMVNESEFGLVGGLWTKDIARALRFAEVIEAGQVYVNTWSTAAVQASFGGYKLSGYGREKGIEALKYCTQVKSVTIKLD